MASAITDQYLQDRIDNALLVIAALEDAILDLSTGTLRSYTLNTGQTTQTVTKKNISVLSSAIDSWYARMDYWNSRLNGGAVVYVRGAC